MRIFLFIIVLCSLVALAGSCINSGDCNANSDCAGGQVCSAGTCVQCKGDSDCGAGDVCRANVCIGAGEGEGEGAGEGEGEGGGGEGEGEGEGEGAAGACCEYSTDGATTAATCDRGTCAPQTDPGILPAGCTPVDVTVCAHQVCCPDGATAFVCATSQFADGCPGSIDEANAAVANGTCATTTQSCQ